MASITTRSIKSGTRYDVRWRPATAGETQPSVTFSDPTRAENFARLVGMCGDTMPTLEQLEMFGFADVAATIPAAPPAVLSLVDYCGAYVNSLTDPKPKQVRDYHDLIRRHIAPFFGQLALTVVDRAALREWQRWALREGGHGGKALSASTVRRVRAAVLYPALAMACRRQDDGSPGPREWNPFDGLDAPPLQRNPTAFLHTADEAALLLRGAYAVDVPTGDAVAVMLALGTRFGETFGMTRPAVTPARSRVEVRTVAAIIDHPGRYELREGPKSDGSWRTLLYGPALAPVIDRRYAAAAHTTHRLLFPGPDNPVMQASTFRKRYRRALHAAAALGLERLDVTPHGLRTTAMTHLGESDGVSAVAVQDFAGHGNLATTQGYTRRTGRGAPAVAAALDEFMAHVVTGTPAAA
jgi:integrase